MAKLKQTDYKPVNCSFVDWVEHYATLRTEVNVVYTDAAAARVSTTSRIKTWVLESGIEYLVLADDYRIRLDHVISIEDKVLADMDGHCSL